MNYIKYVLILTVFIMSSGCSTFNTDPDNEFPPIEYDSDIEYIG